jgi:hypothetical protein
MNKSSAKYKIYGLIVVMLIVTGIFFGFVYGWMDGKNAVIGQALADKNQEFAEVFAEQQSYELGKKDLVTLEAKPFQPDDLFSQDTKVVKEIKTLETLAQGLELSFTLRVSGTVKTAPKLAKATAQLYTVPYTVILEGPFDKITNYIETTEHLNFVTATKTIRVEATEGGQTRATLASEFYIKP